MVRLRDVYSRVQACHQYKRIDFGSTRLPVAFRCSEIVNAIRAYVRIRCSQHPRLSQRELIIAIGKDLIAMKLIYIAKPGPKR